MSTVPFSIVIPTCQRHDTLKYAIKSVLNQTFQDFELVIMDNFSTPETAEVVFSFGDDRIKYYRASERLSATDNWELGLSYAKGEYICLIGDDDGLMPDGLAIGKQLAEYYQTSIIAWDAPYYRWGNVITPWLRNILDISLYQASPQIYNSHQYLSQVYDGTIKIDCPYGPRLYHGLVHRDIINKVKYVNDGKYFLTHCMVADIYASIVNSYFSDSYIFSYRPLSIKGFSEHSTGMSVLYPTYNSKASDEFKKDTAIEMIHPRLIPSKNVFISTASDFLYAKDAFFPDDPEMQFNIRGLIDQMLSWDGTDPNRYEDVIHLARKYGIAESEIKLPEPVTELSMPERIYHGPIRDSNGTVVSLRINCQLAGASNVAEVAKLAWGILEGETIIDLNPPEPLQQELDKQELSMAKINQFLERENLTSYLQGARTQVATHWFSTDLVSLARDYAGEAGQAHTALLITGIKDHPFTEEEQNFLEDVTTCVLNRGFNDPSFIRYFLVLILYYYPHQFPQGWYEGVSIPEWFMDEFLKFLLVNPAQFTDHYDAENYYEYVLGLITYLHGKITTNRGSIIWHNIRKFIRENSNFYLLNGSGRDLSQFQQKLQEIYS